MIIIEKKKGMKKKFMKKVISLVLIVLFITGCMGKKEEFYLTYNNKDIKLDTVFNDNHDYNDYFESENCAFGDRDVTYMYDDIEVEAYGNKNNELIIYSIRLINENVKTNEGVKMYDNISDAIKTYGDDYIKNENTYIYNHGKTSLTFITDNDIIQSIEYSLNNLE